MMCHIGVTCVSAAADHVCVFLVTEHESMAAKCMNMARQLLLVVAIALGMTNVSANVYLARQTNYGSGTTAKFNPSSTYSYKNDRHDDSKQGFTMSHSRFMSTRRSNKSSSSSSSSSSSIIAMVIPGYGLAEQVFVGGFQNFLSLYNLVITARILLSWFPQAQGVAVLQPVYAITDPYLNVFRGVIPPLFGLDFSPIIAFFLLNLLSNATAAVGYELPTDMKQKFQQQQMQPMRLPASSKSKCVARSTLTLHLQRRILASTKKPVSSRCIRPINFQTGYC
jgi:uncharacterized protein YggT (Ycf19 family)